MSPVGFCYHHLCRGHDVDGQCFIGNNKQQVCWAPLLWMPACPVKGKCDGSTDDRRYHLSLTDTLNGWSGPNDDDCWTELKPSGVRFLTFLAFLKIKSWIGLQVLFNTCLISVFRLRTFLPPPRILSHKRTSSGFSNSATRSLKTQSDKSHRVEMQKRCSCKVMPWRPSVRICTVLVM